MLPRILTTPTGTALRAPDGAFMQLAPDARPEDIEQALARRAAERFPELPQVSVDERGAQLFFPLVSALEMMREQAPDKPDADSSLPPLALHLLTNSADEDEADTLLTSENAVLRVHREDDVLWIHPLADPNDPHAIRAQDIRGRRLAASPAPALMNHLWGEDGGDTLDDLPEVIVHLASAEILRSAMAWLHGTESHPHELTRIEMSTLRVSRHRVIRVPNTEPLPKAS